VALGYLKENSFLKIRDTKYGTALTEYIKATLQLLERCFYIH